MRLRVLLTLLSIALSCATLFPQAPGANWSTTPTGINPPQRRENPGVSDGISMYVFGGQSGASGGMTMNDLWAFDGISWSLLTANGAIGSPPARARAGVTWDFARNRLVVFGGDDAQNTVFSDTWEWDPTTNTWTDVTPVGTSPSARRFCALAFDAANGQVLLFGGLDANGSTHLNDTWVFSGSTWTQLTPPGALPGVRRQHALVERPDFGDVILCGGQEAGGAGMYGDTWRWDGANWAEIVTTTSPVGRVAMDAAYDQLRQRIVIAGGNPGPTGTISEFDSFTNDWIIRPLDPGIFKVTRYFAAYVPALGKTFKASGQALNATRPPTNTYEYQSDFVASFSLSGVGCPGSLGVPTQSANALPWTNRSLSINASGVSNTEQVWILAGLDNTTWNGLSLPLNTTPLGVPGCTLYVAPILQFPLGVGPGAAPFVLPIPNDPAFAGVPFYTQMLVIDTVTGVVGSTPLGTGVFGVL